MENLLKFLLSVSCGIVIVEIVVYLINKIFISYVSPPDYSPDHDNK